VEQHVATVRVFLDVTEDVPTFYVNYAEVAHSANEFVLLGARLPTKPSATQLAEAAETGDLKLQPVFQALLPTTLIPGLIAVLSAQRAAYEARFGPIKELGDPNVL